MTRLSRCVGIIVCGSLLGLGLTNNVVLAGDDTKTASSGEREGGQAGWGYDPVQRDCVAARPGERIGGRAGRPYNHVKVKREHVPRLLGERTGGQAGRGYDPVQWECVAAE